MLIWASKDGDEMDSCILMTSIPSFFTNAYIVHLVATESQHYC